MSRLLSLQSCLSAKDTQKIVLRLLPWRQVWEQRLTSLANGNGKVTNYGV